MHITKVRSLHLDSWTQNLLNLYKHMSNSFAANLRSLGNKLANSYWEHKLPLGFRRPGELTADSVMWKFIQDKYVKRLFAPEGPADPVTTYLKRGIVPTAIPPIAVTVTRFHVASTPGGRRKCLSTVTKKLAALKGDADEAKMPSPDKSQLGDISNGILDERETGGNQGSGSIQARYETAAIGGKKHGPQQASYLPREFGVGVNAFGYLGGNVYDLATALRRGPKSGLRLSTDVPEARDGSGLVISQ